VTKSRPEAGTAGVPRDEVIAGKEVGVAVVPQNPLTKTAPVVQAVVAEERGQIEMDLAGQSAMPVRELNDVDAEQYAGAVDELGDLETSLERGQTH
tara:strand:+ start:148 stop:435 length:288 start_codon:yes stop_codon:yes gene_type:complete